MFGAVEGRTVLLVFVLPLVEGEVERRWILELAPLLRLEVPLLRSKFCERDEPPMVDCLLSKVDVPV